MRSTRPKMKRRSVFEAHVVMMPDREAIAALQIVLQTAPHLVPVARGCARAWTGETLDKTMAVFVFLREDGGGLAAGISRDRTNTGMWGSEVRAGTYNPELLELDVSFMTPDQSVPTTS